jgi:hypothetical protein
MTIKSSNDNPILREWRKRYFSQTADIQEKLDALEKMESKDCQLRIIKKSKKGPIDGDIFLLCPRESIFFYGKVMKADIDHLGKDIFFHGKNLVFIFKYKTKELSIDNFRSDYSNLLIPPEIVDNSCWYSGLFYTIGNEKVTDAERCLEYGFYNILSGKYYKENGVELEHRPIILGTYGVSTITGIASNVEKEIIINPRIIDF